MHKKITIHFYQKEDISEEDNRGDVANSHCNSAAMNPVCWPSGSGHWSHILPTPAVPPADPLPTGLPIAAPLALPVLFPVAVLVFPCDGSCPRLLGGFQVSSAVDIGASNEELSVFLQHTVFTSHVNRSTYKNLEIERGHDQLTILMWLH